MARSRRSTGHRPPDVEEKRPDHRWLEDSLSHMRELSDRVAELSTLMGISALLSSDRPLQDILSAVCKLGAEICKAEVCFIQLADGEDDLVCVARHTPDDLASDSWERIARLYGRKALQRGEVVSSSTLLVRGGDDSAPSRSRMGGICAVPLKGKAPRVGTIVVGYPGTHRFTAREKDMLNAIAAQVTMAVERSWLFDRLQEQLARSNSLREVANSIGANLELDLVLDDIVNQASMLLAAEFSAIFLLDHPQGKELDGESPILEGSRVYGCAVELEEGPLANAIQMAVETRKPAVVQSPLLDPPAKPPEEITANDYRVALAVPLLWQDEVSGALVVCYLEKRRFDDSDISLAEDFAAQAAMALRNAWLYEGAMEDRTRLEAAINQINNHGIVLLDDRMNLRFANPATFWLLGVSPKRGEMPLAEWSALLKKGLVAGEDLDLAIERIATHPEETVVAKLAARGTADSPRAIKLVSLPLRQLDGSIKGRVTLLEEGN